MPSPTEQDRDAVSQAARNLLAAERELELITTYLANTKPIPTDSDPNPLVLHITWNLGSACTGYKETERAVHRLMVSRMLSMLNEVLEQARENYSECFAELEHAIARKNGHVG